MPNTDDIRILGQKALLSPRLLLEEIPMSKKSAKTVAETRSLISEILKGKDRRMIFITGPCSIHDENAALEYADFVAKIKERFSDELLIIMRTYFEKPRTVVGWKGLLNDPYLDNSFKINDGLRIARRLLATITEKGIGTATEFLDPITPQFLADLISYGAIGARTTESQIHRELSSGLSMPIGFKNGTDGTVQVAIDAVRSARHSHWFPSVTKDGVVAIFQTAGNFDTHIILRGGAQTGPNYGRDFIKKTRAELVKAELPEKLIIDCSHGNSNKDYRRQSIVADELAEQITEGETAIAGVMIESNLVEGRQNYNAKEKCVYGQSITDACISISDTEKICETLAKAVKTQKTKN